MNRRNPCAGTSQHRGKRRFSTRDEAEHSMHLAWGRTSFGPGPLPVRAYLCQCGHWHLTTKPAPFIERGEVVSDTQPLRGHLAHARIS